MTHPSMQNPRKGLHFGDVVIYDASHGYDDSRIPVIHEDGSEGWCKWAYIDDIGDVDTPVHKIEPKIGDTILVIDGESKQEIRGVIVGKSEDEKTLIIAQSAPPPDKP